MPPGDFEARDEYGRSVTALALHGFIWLYSGNRSPYAEKDLKGYLGTEIDTDFAAARTAELFTFERSESEYRINWKLPIEAAMEAYHFRTAHRKTIGGRFLDARAVLYSLGRHHRFLVPRQKQTGSRRIRDLAFITYNIFPNSLLFVNRRHCDWIRVQPLEAGRSRLSVTTLRYIQPPFAEKRYARANFEYFRAIVEEDNVLNESQQANYEVNPDVPIYFGGMEAALTNFNRSVDRFITGQLAAE